MSALRQYIVNAHASRRNLHLVVYIVEFPIGKQHTLVSLLLYCSSVEIRMNSFRLTAVLLLLSVVAAVHCYSTGAPATACTNIYPEGHSGTSQDLSTSPFQLSLSDFDQSNGGEIFYVPGEEYACMLLTLVFGT